MQKILLFISAIIIGATANVALANSTTLYFDNNDVDLGNVARINITNQYAAFGIIVTDAYRYIDNRDPFLDPDGGYFGLSNGDVTDNSVTIGRIDFINSTSFFTADWWTIGGTTTIIVDAYDSGGNHQGSFSGGGNGTDTILGDIAYVTWHDSGGLVQLANISYNTVPIPAAVWLFGSGLIGLIGIAKRKKAA